MMSSTPDPFTRQRGLSGFGEEGQARLERARVAIVGVGGLGCPVAQYVSAAGVGALTLIDADHVSVTNLHRQILFGPDDIGAPKVAAAADALQRTAPGCDVTPVHERLTPDNAAALIAGHDVVVDATDTWHARRAVEAAAHEASVPVVWGAVTGWHGQVTVFDSSVRLDDVFPDTGGLDWDTCDGGAVYGPVCGVIGTAMASEAVRLAAGGGASLSGILAVTDARTGRWRDVPIAARTGGARG